MPNHIEIKFTTLLPEQYELLIAHLAEAGFVGFEETGTELKAFIPEKSYDKGLLQELAFKYQLPFTEKIIPEQNWNATWESAFQPVVIDDFVTIRADFHKPAMHTRFEIIITPKMSFGTGHHATTYMMVHQMRDIDIKNKKVFDFGTGTGILAILAEKMGAAEITAIDNDEWSICNAEENIERNQCRKIILHKAASMTANVQYDIILANINRNVITECFASFAAYLRPGGVLLLSGLLAEDEQEIHRLAASCNLVLSAKMEQNHWILLKFSC
jgi:ribosomal protein L11 methyltransferase